MTFTKLHANRLRKLITHLLRGKLSKSKFDYVTRFEVAANMIAFLRSKGYSYAD